MTLNGLRKPEHVLPRHVRKAGHRRHRGAWPWKQIQERGGTFLRKDFSDANKEQTRALLSGFWQDMASDVEGARGLEPGTLDTRQRLDHRSPQDAVDAKLVDGLLYEDELTALWKKSWTAKSLPSSPSASTRWRSGSWAAWTRWPRCWKKWNRKKRTRTATTSEATWP